MAAIDPDAMPEFGDEASSNKPPRATLKIIRPPPGMDLDDDDEDYSDDEDEDEESSDDEANGGPSDPAKAKLARQAAKLKELEDVMDEDDDESDGDIDLKAAISKLIKGKGRLTDDDDDASEDSEGFELDEVVVCTLDPEKVCSLLRTSHRLHSR